MPKTSDSHKAKNKHQATDAQNNLVTPDYPLSAYGFYAASGPLETFTQSVMPHRAFYVRMLVPAGKPINAVGAVVTKGGQVGIGAFSSFAIYDDSGKFVAFTKGNSLMWTRAGWAIDSFTTPIAAQSADRFVYVTYYVDEYITQPLLAYNLVATPAIFSGGYKQSAHRRAFYSNDAAPPSFDPATYGTDSNFLPLYVLG